MDVEVIAFGGLCVLVWGEVQIGIAEIAGMRDPLCGEARFFEHVLQAFTGAIGNQAELGVGGGFQRGANGTEGRVGIGEPVECVERDDEIEFIAEREISSIGDFEMKIGRGMFCGEGNHFVRGVNAEDGAARKARCDLRSDAAVTAADVEDTFGAVETKKGEDFFCHGFLEAGTANVIGGVPFGHAKKLTVFG